MAETTKTTVAPGEMRHECLCQREGTEVICRKRRVPASEFVVARIWRMPALFSRPTIGR